MYKGQVMQSLEVMRRTYPAFYDAVKTAQQAGTGRNRGHDLAHDVTVAQLAYSFAPDERTAQKAWVAALCHSQDYLVEPPKDPTAFATRVHELLRFLPEDAFFPGEIAEIAEAAVRHGEKNRNDQSMVQIVLQDADRCANLTPGVEFRIGQGHPHLPALELTHLANGNPASTYAEPCSCMDDMRNCVTEYLPQMRTPAGKAYAKRCAEARLGFLTQIRSAYEGLGLAGVDL